MRKTDLDKNRKKNTGQTRRILYFSFLNFLAFISIIILCSLTFTMSGCTIKDLKIDDVQEAIKGKPQISEMVICKSVDSNHAPVDPTSGFDLGTNSIFLSVKFTNFKTTDNLKVTWTYIDTNRELSVQEFSPPEFSSGYYSFNIAIADVFPGGKYTAQVELNNDIVKTIEFSVKSK
jgi:hypothetical protein